MASQKKGKMIETVSYAGEGKRYGKD